MNGTQKRVAAIHDLSGFGRCSLSVIIPVLSVMGIQVCPVPTAALSTHTGGLGDVVMRDLTNYIIPALNHYRRLEIGFDCVYSGFLASQDQIDCCLEFFGAYKGGLALVDPVMGDHGRPYKTCTEDIRRRMSELVAIADIITPNLTEAAMLLNIPYPSAPLTNSQAKSILVRLCELGPSQVVVTGTSLAGGALANVGYDCEKNAFWRSRCDYVPVKYPGTGDIYASVLIGAILSGDSLPISMGKATSFVELAVKTTFSYGADARYGVMLEPVLPWLTDRVVVNNYETL